MGASQSRQEEEVEAVSVERGVDEDGATKIIFTKDFLKYIRKKGSGDEEEEEPEEEPAIDAESVVAPLRNDYGRREGGSGSGHQEGGDVWRQKYEMERAKNEKLKNVVADEFERTVSEVRGKIASQVPQMVPVCEDHREKVSECYLGNLGRPLNCHNEVKEYLECVQKMRQGELDTAKPQTAS